MISEVIFLIKMISKDIDTCMIVSFLIS